MSQTGANRAGLMTSDTARSARETSARLGPLGDIGPVPRWPATDRPARFGEAEATSTPSVHGTAAHLQAFGDFDGSNGIAGHEISVGKVLTDGKGCRHNTYMTNSDYITADEISKGDTITLPSGRTRRIQRVHTVGRFVEVIFPDMVEGHIWIKADEKVERVA